MVSGTAQTTQWTTNPSRVLGPTLGICRRYQGVGLDFVRKREYGRLRWL